MLYLSKSRYCSLWQCPKLLWLNKFKPEEKTEDPSLQARFEEGNVVGDLAMGLFGDFIEVTSFKEDGRLDLDEMMRLTQQYINEGVENICEASFSYNGLYCAVDILRKMRKNVSDKFTKNCIDLILALKDDKDCVNNIKEIIKDTSNDLYIRYFALTELFNKYVSEKDIPFLKLLVTDTSRVIPSEKLQKEWERVAPGLNNNRPIGASKLSLKLKEYPIRDVAQEMLLKFQ